MSVYWVRETADIVWMCVHERIVRFVTFFVLFFCGEWTHFQGLVVEMHTNRNRELTLFFLARYDIA